MEYQDVHILLVEDDSVDRMLIQDAFEDNGILNNMSCAKDGLEALAMLRGQEGHAPVPRPFLILLDLNMPRMNGIEFLHEMRQDENLHDSIVFVLTTSNDEQDRLKAYTHHIAGYVIKSEVGDDFIKLVQLVKDFKMLIKFPSTRQ